MKPFRRSEVPLLAYARLETTYLDPEGRPIIWRRAAFVRRRIIAGNGRVLHEHLRRIRRARGDSDPIARSERKRRHSSQRETGLKGACCRGRSQARRGLRTATRVALHDVAPRFPLS